MKKIITILLIISAFACFVACGEKKEEKKETQSSSQSKENTTASVSNQTTPTEEKKILVVYFSATGNTKAIAKSIADGLSAALYEIVPKIPYTQNDLNYNDTNSRTSLEMNDPSSRPEISDTVENFEQYDTIFIGYPIWWGEAPRILDTFVESYDFTGKTVIPFCTSGSSGIGSSADTLQKLAGGGNWMEGKRFRSGSSDDVVIEWADRFK